MRIIRDFFGSISHEWMVKFLQHRIADRRILRLIQKWLRAGVSEDGEWSKTEVGNISGQSRKHGKFLVLRKTVRKRLLAKLKELKEELRRRWHEPVEELGKWLRSVMRGYFNHHAVPGNLASLNSFRREVSKRWMRALRRRGQKHPMTWARLRPILERWLPIPKLIHPYPNLRFDAKYLR